MPTKAQRRSSASKKAWAARRKRAAATGKPLVKPRKPKGHDNRVLDAFRGQMLKLGCRL